MTTGRSVDQDLARSRETAGIPACFTTAQQAHGSADSMPGATVQYIGQMSDISDPARKVREWTTLDLIVNYTLICLPSAAQKRSRRICQGRRQEHGVERRQGKERHAGLYRRV